MKAGLRLLEHSRLIKFVGGPHPIVQHPVTSHPCAPAGLMPSAPGSAAPVTGHAATFQSRNTLSKRFRYRTLDDIEIEDVLTGGADVFIK